MDPWIRPIQWGICLQGGASEASTDAPKPWQTGLFFSDEKDKEKDKKI
jgi:hypothetical protein